MSGGGGDSGGDSGGATKGGGNSSGGFMGGGDTADYGAGSGGYFGNNGGSAYSSNSPGFGSGFGGDTANYGDISVGGAGGGASAFTSPGEQAGFQGSGSGGLDSFVSDPTGGNLSGPGPVGGDPGLSGAGGGTNTPLAIGDYSFDSPLNGVSADSFTGSTQPSAVSGVSGTGANPVQTAVGTSGGGGDSLGGVAASSFAAPTGVTGNADSTSITNDLDKLTKPAAATSKGTDGGGGVLSSLGINSNNAAGAAVAGAGLLNNLVQGNKTTQSMDALRTQAMQGNQIAQQLLEQSKPITEKGAGFIDSGKSQVDTGAALQQYVATGKLPEGYELQVTEAINAAKTRAISNAAANGQPTDPKLNTTLAASLDAIDRQAPMMREQLAGQLAATGNSIVGAGNQTAGTGNALSGNSLVTAGLQATGISSDIYKKLADLDNTQNANRGQAISNFASALNGGGTRGLTLKVA